MSNILYWSRLLTSGMVIWCLLQAGSAAGRGLEGDGRPGGAECGGVACGGAGCGGSACGSAACGMVGRGGAACNGAGGFWVMGGKAPLTVKTNTKAATCSQSNGSITVNATGGTAPYLYSIDGVNFQTSNQFPNLPGGSYVVYVLDAASGETIVNVILNDLQGPTISVITAAASCLNNDGKADITTTGGTPPFLYKAGSGPYTNYNLLSGLPSGNQLITVEDANGCIATVTAVIPLNNNLTLSMGPGGIICQGRQMTLTETTNADSFSWTPATGLNSTTAAEPAASPSATTTYQLTATLGVCSLTGPETVTVLPAPQANAGPNDTICPGKSAQLQGSGGVQYQWSPVTYLSDPKIADPTVDDPKHSVDYNLVVTDANGCSSLIPASVLVYVTPQPVVFAGDDTAVLVNQPLPLQAIDVNGSGFTQYSWSPAQGLSDPSSSDPIATITGNITYTVTATTADGCVGTGSITIAAAVYSDIIVPNAFTPNGDGRNDILKVDAIGIRDFQAFRVFNRWGQLVFTTSNQGVGWDGSVGGKIQPMDTYVWMAVGVDFSGKVVERRGTVILIR